MKMFIDSSSIYGSILHRKFIDSDLKVHRILLSLVIMSIVCQQLINCVLFSDGKSSLSRGS